MKALTGRWKWSKKRGAFVWKWKARKVKRMRWLEEMLDA